MLSFFGLRHQARCVASHFPHRSFQGSRKIGLGCSPCLLFSSCKSTKKAGRLAVEGVFGRKGELDWAWEQTRARGFGLGRRPARRASWKHRLADHGLLWYFRLMIPYLRCLPCVPSQLMKKICVPWDFHKFSFDGQCKNFLFFLSYKLTCLSARLLVLQAL